MLITQLEDVLISVLSIVGGIIGIHILILLLWKYWCNRRYYNFKRAHAARISIGPKGRLLSPRFISRQRL